MKKKKIILIILLVLGMVLLAGILYLAIDLSTTPGSLPAWPNEYGAAKWVSESPDIWFEVTGEEEEVWDGKFVIDGTEYRCKISAYLWELLFWKEDTDMNQPDFENDLLFIGDFYYLPKKAVPREFIVDPPEKMVVFVSGIYKFFGGERLEFVRQEKEER